MSRVLPSRSPSPTARSHRNVQLALRIMRERLDECLSLDDLSTAAGCRPRSLIRAFNAVVGEPPMTHFRRLRLEELRRRLQSAPKRRIRVMDVAIECGFWHLGHLGATYKSRFGETPQQTLTKRETDP